MGSIILAVLTVFGLYFRPKSLESTDTKLIIHHIFRDTVLRNTDIAAVERCYPSAGGLRLCASGGFFGYWGYFTDIFIGDYFGCYGDRSQCFLVRLKSGRKYVLSCEAPDGKVKAIASHLS